MTPNELIHPTETTGTGLAPHLGRLAWEELLSDTGLNGFMITLGFRVYLDTARAIAVANHFLQRINRHLYGKRFPRHGRFLEGAVVLEHKRHSTRSSNSPHFHFIVAAESLSTSEGNEERLRKVVEYAAGRLLYPTLVCDQPFGEVISGPAFVDAKRIVNANDLANYLTKDCCRFGPVGDALNIGFFGVDGIEGL